MNDKNESMKPTPCFLFLLVSTIQVGCGPSKHHQAIHSDPYGKSLKYRPVDYTTRTITGFLKDEEDNRPVQSATVQIHFGNSSTDPLYITTTNSTGRITFTLKEGSYILVIKHREFEQKEVPIEVGGWDINLNDIKLRPFP
jgi:hypothetical protein